MNISDRDAGRCTFRPQSGGSWRQCHDLAEWADPEPEKLPNGMPQWRERRCDKHRRLDMRTAANQKRTHGWGSDRAEKMVPFDAQAAIAKATAKREREANERRKAFWEEVEVAVEKRDIERLKAATKHLSR